MNNYVDYYNYMNSLNSNQTIMPKPNKKFDYSTKPNVAFMRGNLFSNLYTPYKNFKPMELNPSNEKEYALLLVQMYAFAAHELTLYLDVNPGDSEAIKLRSNYINMYKQALNQYEMKYGPLTVCGTNTEQGWSWVQAPWPWELEA